LPSLGTRRLAEHAKKLKVDLSGGELPSRKVDTRADAALGVAGLQVVAPALTA
jgi:hypothetical protein